MEIFFSGIGAALVAAVVAVAGYVQQQNAARKVERATMYAEALRAVQDYLEGPYRIRRKDGTDEVRRELTQALSTIQSQIGFHTAWLDISAPASVADAYRDLVAAARAEAGPQMTAAWVLPATSTDSAVPLGVPYPRPLSDAALDKVKAAMRRHL